MPSTKNTLNATGKVVDVDPELLAQWLEAGDTVLVDVREGFEHAEERIDGAVLHTLSNFDADALREQHGSSRVVFQCQSGNRSREAAQRCGLMEEPLFHLAGGIEAWKASGRAVVRTARTRLPIMRQVQVTAGALVAGGVALGVTVSPWFLAVAGFVGCGLVFAGVTGWCGMAKLLAAMPWNRSGPQGTSAASCCSP